LTGPVLALDSSTLGGSVAVGVDGRVVAGRILPSAVGASGTLLPHADAALREAGFGPEDVAAVVVGGGPGSFTGLRIAAATAKAIVRVRRVPLFAYSGLMGAAAARRRPDRPTCAFFDARNREVYAGCWRFAEGVEEVMAITALGLDEALECFRGAAPLFTGEGAAMHRDAIAAAFGDDAVAAEGEPSVAAGLLWLAGAAPELGRVDDPSAWEPDYVRSSGAERIAAQGRVR
jgi:tRNA threonylcarbamoyladenosine biosynthesis protein TsaB